MGLFKKKRTLSKELDSLHGKRLSYAVERNGSDELVLGRKGGISVTDDEIIVVCDGHEIFRCVKNGAAAAELMSRNGADIKGVDSNTGEQRHIVVYFSNLRQ